MSFRSLSLCLALLLAPVASWAQATVTPPALPQPSATGDIVAVRYLNPTGSSMAAGWVRFGQLFKDGDVASGQSLAARLCTNVGCTTGSTVYAGYDCHASHPTDSSCLLADLVINSGGTLTAGSHQDFMILGCGGGGQPSCPAAPGTPPPSAATVAALSDLATPIFATNASAGSFNETQHCTGATSILASANSGGSTVTRFSNGAMKEYVATGTANSGKLRVTCVIDAFQDGKTVTDVIIDNNWYLTGGKADAVYDFSMTVPAGATSSSHAHGNGSCANSFLTASAHALYEMWHCKVVGNGAISPLVQYDVPYLVLKTAAFYSYDWTYGVAHDSPSTPAGGIVDVNNMFVAGGLTGKVTSGIGLIESNNNVPGWFGGGGNSGQLTQDHYIAVQWLLSQDPTAWINLLFLSEGTGGIPWHFRDETNNTPVDPTVSTVTFGAGCSTVGGDVPANGYPVWGANPPTPSANGTVWVGMACESDGTNHQIDFAFNAYWSSLDFFQQQLVEYQWNASPIGIGQTRQGNAFLFGRAIMCAEPSNLAARGQAWCMRSATRSSLYLPDTDATQVVGWKAIYRTILANSLQNFIDIYEYSASNSNSIGFAFNTGQMESVVDPAQASGPPNGTAETPPWQAAYFLGALRTLSQINWSPYSAQATELAAYIQPSLTGLTTQGQNGFDTMSGGAFTFIRCGGGNGDGLSCFIDHNSADPTKFALVTWWQQYNLLGPPVGYPNHYPQPWGCGNAGNGTDYGACNSNVNDWTAGYAVQSINWNAQLWNIRQDPQALEGFARSFVQTVRLMNGASPTIDQKNTVYPIWTTKPIMTNGVELLFTNQVVETGTGTASITCVTPNALLVSAWETGTKTFTGCNGGIDLMVSQTDGNATFNPGTTGSYMYASWFSHGVQTFNSTVGNHYMKGCGSCNDTGGHSVYNIGSGATSGSDTIENFNAGIDTLGVHTNGSTCTSAATVVSSCMAVSGSDTVLTINGKTVTLKGIRDKTALQSRITMI